MQTVCARPGDGLSMLSRTVLSETEINPRRAIENTPTSSAAREIALRDSVRRVPRVNIYCHLSV
jgi:hypothetical protein